MRVARDFGPERVDSVLAELQDLEMPLIAVDDKVALERVQAAIVLAARGDRKRFNDLAELAKQDWRDVLVAAGLADEDWRDQVNEEFGSDQPSN